MNKKDSRFRAFVDVFTLFIALCAFVAALNANKQAKEQNLIASVSAQIQSCLSLSQDVADPIGLGAERAPDARTKAQHLSLCLVEYSENGEQKFRECLSKVNKVKEFDVC